MEGRLSSVGMERKIVTQYGFDVRLWGGNWYASVWFDTETQRDEAVKKAKKHGTIRDDDIRLTSKDVRVEG